MIFFLFHIEIEGKGGWIIGGGGPKGMLAPLSNYWGGLPPPPGPPSSYAYVVTQLYMWAGGRKSRPNGLGHITNMAPGPYIVNFKKSSSPAPTDGLVCIIGY